MESVAAFFGGVVVTVIVLIVFVVIALACEGESKSEIVKKNIASKSKIEIVKENITPKSKIEIVKENIVRESNDEIDSFVEDPVTPDLPSNQIGETCYAEANAKAVHHVLNRVGYNINDCRRLREHFQTCETNKYGGCIPSRDSLRDKILELCPPINGGYSTSTVLGKLAPLLGIHHSSCTEKEACDHFRGGKAVIASFRMRNPEGLILFCKFYNAHPTGILNKADMENIPLGGPTVGHSVVMTEVGEGFLKFINSWGLGFGEDGYFKVKNGDVLKMEFFVVHGVDNLLPEEKDSRDLYKAKTVINQTTQKHGISNKIWEKAINSMK